MGRVCESDLASNSVVSLLCAAERYAPPVHMVCGDVAAHDVGRGPTSSCRLRRLAARKNERTLRPMHAMAREHNLQDFNKVWGCKCLGNFPQSNVAQLMLERVAKQVEPICQARRWSIRNLREFFPSNPGLQGMNVNRGQTIHIRLRPSCSKSEFLPWQHILGTMLHELCHMAIGPHNAAFYALLDELWEEVEKLPEVPGPGGSAIMVVDAYGRPVTGQAAQIAIADDVARRQGQGGVGTGAFAGEGHRLGAGALPHRPLQPHQRREAAAAAAEARLQRASVQGVGGRRLGSSASELEGAGRKRPASAQQLPTDRAGKAAMIAAASERRLARARADAMACANCRGEEDAPGNESRGTVGAQSHANTSASTAASSSACPAPARPSTSVEVIELDGEGQEVRHSLPRPQVETGAGAGAGEEEEVVLVGEAAKGWPTGSSSASARVSAPVGPAPTAPALPSYTCPVCTYRGEAGSQALACEVCGTVLGDNSRVPAALVWAR